MAFMEEGAFVIYTGEGRRRVVRNEEKGEEAEAAVYHPRQGSGTRTHGKVTLRKFWNKEFLTMLKNTDDLNCHLIV